MASRKTIIRAIHHLRASGCYNAHLEDEGAIEVLASDWFSSFLDITDVELLGACSRWLESEEGRRWPTKYDLREGIKAAKAHTTKSFEGCEACDGTGWRELIRIDPADKRERFVAPCSCPKGYHFSHPPPPPANYTGPKWPPPEPWDVVVQKWDAKGYQVLVASEQEPHFGLEDLDTSEATRDRLIEARKHRAEIAAMTEKLVNKFRMFPEDEERRKP